MDEVRSIALVVPGLSSSGGLASAAAFLYRVIRDYSPYQLHLYSLATSFTDSTSVRLLRPSTWRRGISVVEGVWDNVKYKHIGAYFVEFEFQRYRPRTILTKLLNQHDLIQVVAGTPAWALVASKTHKPVCLQVASLTLMERKSRLARGKGLLGTWRRWMAWITSKLDIMALKFVNRVFVENEWMATTLKQVVDPSRVIFAPPGVDIKFLHPTQYAFDGYILSVGRFADPRKNVRLLFTAYALLAKRVASVPKLVLVGRTPPTKEDLQYAAELGIAHQIEIWQDVSREQLRSFYQGASLFVLSSDEEGFGFVIVEAMACGLPVVSTRCGGPETIIVEGETGLLTPVGDATALAQAMAQLLENPKLRRQMGRLGREIVETRFSLEAAGAPYLKVYRELQH